MFYSNIKHVFWLGKYFPRCLCHTFWVRDTTIWLARLVKFIHVLNTTCKQLHNRAISLVVCDHIHGDERGQLITRPFMCIDYGLMKKIMFSNQELIFDNVLTDMITFFNGSIKMWALWQIIIIVFLFTVFLLIFRTRVILWNIRIKCMGHLILTAPNEIRDREFDG